jgi:hypothetical protein
MVNIVWSTETGLGKTFPLFHVGRTGIFVVEKALSSLVWRIDRL